jgi:hypothetical protein
MIWDFGYAAMLSKMAKANYRYTRFLVLVWFCFVCLPPNLMAQNTADPHDSEFSLNKIAANSGQYNFIIAQDNRNGEIENGSEPAQNDESGQASKSDKQSSKPENKAESTQTFEPTEKVEADQAVDFPYDI